MSAKAFAPATDRNRGPIADVLRDVLPARALVLEVASGSGQHAVYFAGNFPHVEWQPSDADPAALKSIAAWRDEADLPNLLPPVQLDVTQSAWPVAAADFVVSINLIHIAPWEACVGLMRGAASLLPTGSLLFLYGPFFQRQIAAAPSNVEFDRSLRAKDARWGVRYLEEVTAEAQRAGFQLGEVVPMPANNLSVFFTRV